MRHILVRNSGQFFVLIIKMILFRKGSHRTDILNRLYRHLQTNKNMVRLDVSALKVIRRKFRIYLTLLISVRPPLAISIL